MKTNKFKSYLSACHSIFLIVLLFAFVSINGCGKKDQTTGSNKQENKSEERTNKSVSAHVDFDITGDITGKMSVDWNNKKMKMEQDAVYKGQKVNTVMINDGTTFYMYSTAAGMKFGTKGDAKKFGDTAVNKNQDMDFSNLKDKLKGYEKTGTEEILGKTCDVYKKGDKISMSIYDELYPLKIVTNKVTFTATKFDPDVKLSDDLFTPPSDVKFQEIK